MIRRINIGNTIVWIIFLLTVVILYYTQIKKKSERVNNSTFTYGTITGINKVAKGSRYVHYKYRIDNKNYEGSVPIEFCLECNNDCCNVGSKVKVRYEEGNPSNSDLVH